MESFVGGNTFQCEQKPKKKHWPFIRVVRIVQELYIHQPCVLSPLNGTSCQRSGICCPKNNRPWCPRWRLWGLSREQGYIVRLNPSDGAFFETRNPEFVCVLGTSSDSNSNSSKSTWKILVLRKLQEPFFLNERLSDHGIGSDCSPRKLVLASCSVRARPERTHRKFRTHKLLSTHFR